MSNSYTKIISIIILSVFIVNGCGDENKTIQSNTLVKGEYTDERFQFAREYINEDVLDIISFSFSSSSFFLDPNPHPHLSLRENSELLSYSINELIASEISDEGWYVYEYDVTINEKDNETIFAIGTDSVQLLLEKSFVEFVSYSETEFDAMDIRNKIIWFNNFADSGISKQTIKLSVDNIDSPTEMMTNILVIDTLYSKLQSDSNTYNVNLYSSIIGSNIKKLYIEEKLQNCPVSGSIDIETFVETFKVDSTGIDVNKFDGLWNYESKYDSSNVQLYKLYHNNTYWEYTTFCE